MLRTLPNNPALLMALSIALLCFGCRSQDLSGRDRRVLSASFSATLPFNRLKQSTEQPSIESEQQATETTRKKNWVPLLEFTYHGGPGDFVEYSKDIEVDDSLFLNQSLDVDFSIQEFSLGMRQGAVNRAGFGFAYSAALQAHWLDLKIRSNTKKEHEIIRALGPKLGLHFSYQPVEALQLYASGHQAIGFTNAGEYLTSNEALELGMQFSPHPQLHLSLAWRTSSYEAFSKHSESDIFVDHSGPQIGLHISF